MTHWWEYFRSGEPDEPFIDFLHETLRHLCRRSDVQVISFADLASGEIGLNYSKEPVRPSAGAATIEA